MSYHIDPRLALRDETIRIATEQLREAMRQLEERPEGIHTAVHQARKGFKRVRGLYRLVRRLDKGRLAAENGRIRDMARTLSAARDAAAIVETLDLVLQDDARAARSPAIARVRERLLARRDALAADEAGLQSAIAAAITTCGDAAAALHDLGDDGDEKRAARTIAAGWAKTSEGARAAIAVCRDGGGAHEIGGPRADAFHDLRKRAQDHWMQTRLCRDVWPSLMHQRQDEAKRLVDLLGQACDLSVLGELAEAKPDEVGQARDRRALLALLVPRMESLRRRALERAESIFCEKPDVVKGRMTALWRASARA